MLTANGIGFGRLLWWRSRDTGTGLLHALQNISDYILQLRYTLSKTVRLFSRKHTGDIGIQGAKFLVDTIGAARVAFIAYIWAVRIVCTADLSSTTYK